jgi:hypothetical protein
MKDMILGKMVESIQNKLPNPISYTGEAYVELIDYVIEDVIGSKIENAIQSAHQEFIWWNKETERYETIYKRKGE